MAQRQPAQGQARQWPGVLLTKWGLGTFIFIALMVWSWQAQPGAGRGTTGAPPPASVALGCWGAPVQGHLLQKELHRAQDAGREVPALFKHPGLLEAVHVLP